MVTSQPCTSSRRILILSTGLISEGWWLLKKELTQGIRIRQDIALMNLIYSTRFMVAQDVYSCTGTVFTFRYSSTTAS